MAVYWEALIGRFLQRQEILQRNRELIAEFVRFQSVRGRSNNRLRKYVSNLATLAIALKKPFDEATREDISQLLQDIQHQAYAHNTQRDFKVLLKVFYQWMFKCDKRQYPPVISWIECGSDEWKDVRREDLIEAGDVAKILAAAFHQRDKAMIALLWTTGARLSEIMNLRIRDFYKDQATGLRGVRINGTKNKFSKRDFPITDSVTLGLLDAWFNCHPRKDQPTFPEAFAWVRQDGEQISSRLFADALVTAHKLAGVAKPSNPHHYRHTRATFLANTVGITRSQFCYVMGWSQSSKVPDRYLHTDKTDAFRAFAATLDDQEDKEERLTKETMGLLFAALSKPKVMSAFQEALQEMPDERKRWLSVARQIREFADISYAPTAF